MKKKIVSLLAAFSLLTASAQSVYDFTVKNDAGESVPLAQYKGQVLLIVNTATKCGFTPQYKGLEALFQKYAGKGLVILDFPCNQFGEQAPGSIQEIHEFCTANYDIHFPQFEKIEVNGEGEHPLYAYLKSQKAFKGFDLTDKMGKQLDEMLRGQNADYDKSPDIKWNFTKFLVSRDGKVLARYEPTASKKLVEDGIQKALRPDKAEDSHRIFDFVEQLPQFPGGNEALYAWLGKNIKYPAACLKKGISGRVIVSFVVNKDGSISEVKTMRSPDPSLTKEAERLVRNMPKWNPAMQGGKVVRSRMNLPIKFSLE